jgi:hypothetical protein
MDKQEMLYNLDYIKHIWTHVEEKNNWFEMETLSKQDQIKRRSKKGMQGILLCLLCFVKEECYTSQIFFPKMSSQMMCHYLMKFIILGIVTHQLWTHFLQENLGCIIFLCVKIGTLCKLPSF